MQTRPWHRMFWKGACALDAGDRALSIEPDAATQDRSSRGQSILQRLGHSPIFMVPRCLAILFFVFAAIASQPCAAQFYVQGVQQLQELYSQTDGVSWQSNNNWDFSNPYVDPCSPTTLWYGISCDTSLQIIGINLSNNNLTGSIGNIDFSVTNFPALQAFEISGNNVSGSVPISLASASPALTTIGISSNGFSGAIPPLSALSGLQYFDASHNALSGPIPSLTGLTSLNFLSVSDNGLTGPIPDLTGLTGLETLNVSENQLTGAIPSLAGLYGLEYFFAEGNALSGSIPSLAGLTQLMGLFVGNNLLSGEVPSVPSPSNLTNGESTLCPNDLNPTPNPDWDTATGITPWYRDCTHSVPSNIPASERQVLLDFYASTNGDGWLNRNDWLDQPGTECDWYGVTCDDARAHIAALHLSGNNLRGELPSNLSDLTALTEFYAGGNQLGGEIPPLTGFAGLGVFSVSDNGLSGPIPSLSSMGTLRSFQVGGNQLTGAAPSAPTPNHLNRAGSSLCPNALARTPDADWDVATGIWPWYRDCTGPTQATIPASERQALLDLYASTDGDHWTDHGGWLGAPGTECDWFGVSCDNAGGHVVGISLSDNNLQGSLPTSVKDLPALASFHAKDNGLGGAIPSLAALTALQVFDVGVNQLTGPIPDLSSLTALTAFFVSDNQLSGPPPSVPSPNSLVPGQSRLCPNDLNPIANPDWDAATGITPWYRDCLAPEPITIPASERQVLLDLYASTNGDNWADHDGWLGDPGTECDWFGVSCDGQGRHVTKVQLRQNHLDGTLPPLDGLPELKEFWVDNNLLGGELPELSGLAKLQVFYAGNNTFEGAIPALTGLHNLKVFAVSRNGLGGPIPALSDLASLKWLYADSNHLTGSLPPLAALTSLEIFSVSGNELEGSIPALTGLSRLQRINVGGNQFSGDMVSVPSPNNLTPRQSRLCPNDLNPTPNPDWDAATGITPWYRDCRAPEPIGIPASERQALLDLYASTDGDQWTDRAGWLGEAGTECAWFGVTCDDAGEHVAGISLSDNNLQGSLPPSLNALPALASFNAHGNGLDGTIPSLAALTALEVFDVGVNQLTGPIPDLSSLTALTAFFVSENQLSGPVPSVPSPNNLEPGQSALCPNDLDPTPDPDWDAATGVTPWYQDCVGSAGTGATAEDGFDPQANAAVRALVIQPDGSILVGGEFTAMGDQARGHIGRLLPDGSLDPDFAAVDVDGDVEAVVVQPDGKIVLGGGFSAVDGQARGHLARLHADGSLDVDFNPEVMGAVHAIWPQADGTLVLAGDFPKAVGASYNAITRLNVDGALDTGFQVEIEGVVTALVQQPDGRMVIGGAFDQVNGEQRLNLARLEANGTLDPSFAPVPDGAVHALVQQPDGEIVAGGDFTSIDGQGIAHLARLRENGSVNSAYVPQPDAPVRALLLQADGRLLVGGDLTQIAGQARDHLARLNFDGSLDPVFDPGAEAGIEAFAQQADGKLVVAGDFTRIGGQALKYIARLYPDGGLDRTLTVAADQQVESIMLQPDGGIVVAGNFEAVAGLARRYLARIRADGDIDAGFDAKVQGGLGVLATAVLPNGSTLIAGDFSKVGDQVAGNIARLLPDGSSDCDCAFAAATNSWIGALAVRPDGRLVIAGDFTTVNGEPRAFVAGLNADGSLDPSFNAIVDGPVHALVLLPDDKLLIGGGFTSVDGVPRALLARLNADGSLDPAFDAQIAIHGTSGAVHALQRQADGYVVVGGEFRTVGGQYHFGLARVDADGAIDAGFHPQFIQRVPRFSIPLPGTVQALALRADGRLLVAGRFDAVDGVARTDVARLAADGSVDAGWDMQPYLSSFVHSLALQTDGKLLLGGDFAGIGGQVRGNLARIATPEAALQSLRVVATGDGTSAVIWARSGASPELAQPPLLLSSADGANFSVEGTMQYQDGVWRYDELTSPNNQNFWLRTQARVSSGRFNGSSGLVETTRLLYVRHDELDVANVMPSSVPSRSGWRFDLVNVGPHNSRDVQIQLDADEALSIGFVPACTLDSSGGTVVIRCERPSELGIHCDNSGDTQRYCSIGNLQPGQSYSFFVVAAGPDVASVSATILVNGVVVDQHAFTP